MGKSYPASPTGPLPPAFGSAVATIEDLLARARTHDAVAESLAGKVAWLAPAVPPATLRPLRWMVRDHRIKALLLRGQAACIWVGIEPEALG